MLFGKTSALFLLFSVCLAIPASSQAQTLIAENVPSSSTLDAGSVANAVLVGEPGVSSAEPEPFDPKSDSSAQPDPDKLKVIIYPIMGWAPVFGASVKVPDTPSTPGGGSGTTNSSFNGAAMFGLQIEKSKWWGEYEGMWAGMTATRNSPHLKVNANGLFSGAQVGYEFYHDFYLTGGFRHMGIDYSVTLGDFQPFKRSPGVWDPLVGILWKSQVSKKWTLRANVQGGGFGVGSDVDISAVANADWQFAKHFGITLGYGVLHFKISDTKLNQTLTISQTLNGPQFGFGIYF